MTLKNSLKKLLAVAAVSSLTAGAFAGDYGKAVIDDKMPIEADPWHFCDIFDYSTLYEGDGFIREVALKGRYHGQWIDQGIEQGNAQFGDRGWQQRRFRVGYGIEFAGGWELSHTFNVRNYPNNPGTQGFFEDIEELVLEWEGDNIGLALGKFKPNITREYATSSKRIKTIERSQITNEVTADKIWGGAVSFDAAGLSHKVGVFSNMYTDNWEWPRADGGVMVTYQTSYEISDSTELFFDYQYNDVTAQVVADAAANNSDDGGSAYEHVFAIGTENDFGRLGVVTDVIFGFDKGDNLNGMPVGDDTWGFVFLPYYSVTDKLEAVFKYAYMADGEVQRVQDRLNGGFGSPGLDSVHTVYLGLNYYICGDKLKVMFGHEWLSAEDFADQDVDGSSWMMGIRTYW